ncbi:hypothetical protein RchiOBHm_Chr7g0220761 [Rosa chinensis]|uniref:Uncharacterized protein n=1 Tax=Rosa chinensis TaxID=74649 RepID=A0A2P6PCV4_ROSCH|nr:hypothetical protein RchiOBHm_Chr7g0220761 [Rosa chinensis]
MLGPNFTLNFLWSLRSWTKAKFSQRPNFSVMGLQFKVNSKLTKYGGLKSIDIFFFFFLAVHVFIFLFLFLGFFTHFSSMDKSTPTLELSPLLNFHP